MVSLNKALLGPYFLGGGWLKNKQIVPFPQALDAKISKVIRCARGFFERPLVETGSVGRLFSGV